MHRYLVGDAKLPITEPLPLPAAVDETTRKDENIVLPIHDMAECDNSKENCKNDEENAIELLSSGPVAKHRRLTYCPASFPHGSSYNVQTSKCVLNKRLHTKLFFYNILCLSYVDFSICLLSRFGDQ